MFFPPFSLSQIRQWFVPARQFLARIVLSHLSSVRPEKSELEELDKGANPGVMIISGNKTI
jgi:hypothetical protein